LLNASFLGIVNIIVYAGAIMVLFLYVIMLLNLNEQVMLHKRTLTKASVILTGIIFLVVLIGAMRGTQLQAGTGATADIGSVKNLGKVLFTDFLFPFEISSVLFLAAMVGAVLLGKKETVE
jgi:NADH-quinone oxidoreductase subunit J